MTEYAIEVKNLIKKFGKITAVNNISLKIERGEIFGLLGPDGAGKTTTIRMLAGVIDATSGDISVEGVDVIKNPEGIRDKVGYMSQLFSLYGDLTVLENIAFFADIHKVPMDVRVNRIKELLEFSRLTNFVNRLSQDLSGGMKQKLALACTLIYTPTVLYLDEPTTGVDPVSRRDFWKILGDLHTQGVTLLVSTPYMDEADRCTHVALMNNGKILTTDTPADMRKKMALDVIEVLTPDERAARKVLLNVSVLQSVETFGDRVHVTAKSADTCIPEIKQILKQNNIPFDAVDQIPPSLEDVFVYLIGAQEESDV